MPSALTVVGANVDFSNGTRIVSSAMKYVLPVPTDAGEPLVYPQDVTDAKGQPHKKGEPIVTWDKKPLLGDGVVVFNSSEGIYQAGVRGGEGDSRAVIIINHVTEAKAQALDARIAGLTGDEPENMTFQQFKAVEAFARNELGLTNMYDSNVKFVRQKMQDPYTNASGDGTPAFGFKKRNDKDVVFALRMPQIGELIRPDNQALPFAAGSILLKQGEDFRVITPIDLEKTYKSAASFSPVKAADIASFSRLPTKRSVSAAPAYVRRQPM